MKKILLLIGLTGLLYAYEIPPCSQYTKKSHQVLGNSPAINMMIQTLKNYSFPEKISKHSDAFKKLASVENLVSKNVDLVVLWNSKHDYSNLATKLHHVGIDTCSLDLSTLQSYVKGFKILGSIMQVQPRAEVLASYIQNKLDILQEINARRIGQKRVRVYYAKSEDGLLSDCQNSVHTEAISLIGADNALVCHDIKNLNVTINIEKLLMMDPDIIVTSSKRFYTHVFVDTKFQALQAVQNKKIFLIPQRPINWIDNPPSFFKVLGVFWLGQQVYPQYFTQNLQEEKKEFFRLFLNRSSDE